MKDTKKVESSVKQEAEAAVAAQKLKKAGAASDKTQANERTEDAAARRQSKEAETAAAKEKTTNAGDVSRSQDNKNEKKPKKLTMISKDSLRKEGTSRKKTNSN